MSDAADWRPTASIATLRARAALLARVRAYFAAQDVLEVETPILSAATVTDPQIEPLVTHAAGVARALYLHTSPEYPMKRLLAAGSGDIYQVCKVFRDEQRGRWHNPEFTMIEWYRIGCDDAALMADVEALLAYVLADTQPPARPAQRLTYADALRTYAGVDPHSASDAELERAARDCGIDCRTELDRDAKLDLLMGLAVGPKLGAERPCFICDYPVSQAALARVKAGSPAVASRFELYFHGVELANGYHELADAKEQRSRFLRDQDLRRRRGQVLRPPDEHLLAAIEKLPDCAGVALGFDRLTAIALGVSRLADIMAFSIENA